MRTAMTVAVSAALMVALNARAEAGKTCISTATEALPRITGLVVKKSRTRPVPPAILASWKGQSRPVIIDVDTEAVGRGADLFLYVCGHARVCVRAAHDELERFRAKHALGLDPGVGAGSRKENASRQKTSRPACSRPGRSAARGYPSVFAFERLAHRLANFADGNEREHGKDGKSYHHRATP